MRLWVLLAGDSVILGCYQPSQHVSLPWFGEQAESADFRTWPPGRASLWILRGYPGVGRDTVQTALHPGRWQSCGGAA